MMNLTKKQKMISTMVFISALTLGTTLVMINKNSGNETKVEETQIKPEVSPQEVKVIPTKVEQKVEVIKETPKKNIFENKTLSLEIPEGWELKSKECDSVDCTKIVLTKNSYLFTLDTDPMLTGGGFGGAFDGVCSPLEKVSTNVNELIKLDEYFDLSSNNSCMKDFPLNTAQSGVFWGGSKYMTKGSDLPVIKCNSNCGDQNQMLITYSYDFLTYVDGSIDPGKTRLLPQKNSQELQKHLAQMDEIVKSIKFKK